MKISVANTSMSKYFGDEKTIETLAKIGYEAIDYRITNKEAVDVREDYISHCTKLKKIADENNIAIGQFHAIAPSYVNDNSEKTEFMFNVVTRCVEAAGIMGAPYVVVHPPILREYRYNDLKAETKEIAMKFYSRLIPYAKSAGVKIAIENMWNYDLVRARICPTVCSTAVELADYVDTLNDETFCVCLDIGHSLLTYEHPHEAITYLGDRLKVLHVHDVDGINDLHTLPYLGICDWDKTLKALADINFSGDLNFETGGFLNPYPKELVEDAYKFNFSVGKYLRDKFLEYQKCN